MILRILQAIRSGVAEPHPSKPGEYSMQCPACPDRVGTPDGKARLGINLEKRVFYCRRCHWGGSLSDLAGSEHAGSLADALDDVLAPQIDLSQARRVVTERPRLAVAEHPALPNGYRDVLEGGRQALRVLAYLRGRGLDEPAIARLRPGYTFAAPGKGAPDLRGRAIIPLTVGGDVVFWVARALGAVEPKILNPKTPAGGKPLWGLDDLPQGSDVTLVEGPFDAAATPFGTAMLGTALTERQVWQLRRHRPSSVMIMMDGDEPGRAAEPALVRQVSEDVGVQPTVARVPWGRDPGDLSRGGMDVALASATVTTPLSAAIGRLREGGCRR